jgi:hypothetical protein
MKKTRILGGAAVLLITVGLGGILASLVTSNDLFLGSTPYSTPAIATLITFIGAIGLFVAIGRPWEDWDRTTYW